MSASATVVRQSLHMTSSKRCHHHMLQRPTPPSLLSLSVVRSFAAEASQSTKKKGGGGLSYQERKDAVKQKRINAYAAKQARLQKLKTRRDHSPKDVLKKPFREWFNPKFNFEQKMDRLARKENLPWQIRVAGIVERLPVVIPDMEKWQEEYRDLKSYLDRFGRELPKELGGTGSGSGSEEEEEEVAITREELFALLPEGYTPAPRITEHDLSGNIRTTNRQLKTRVYLTIRNNDTPTFPHWSFPTVTPNQNETLLAAAQRSITESVGSDLILYCPSNCPMAVDMIPFKPEHKEKFGLFGTKTFFIRMQRDEGEVMEKDMDVEEYGWLTREEIVDRVKKERGEHASKFYHYLL